MEFRNCKECGRVFQSNGYTKICPRCQVDDEKNFVTVKEYIYDNPGVTMPEASQETGVSEDKILRYLREGRLEIIGHSMLLDCERCGKSITTGRFCKACAQEIERGLKGSFERKEKTKEKEKMYIAEMKNKK